MPPSSPSSTPQHSRVRLDPSKKCHTLPLTSTFLAFPSFILPHACLDVEHPPRNLNTAGIPNSSSSTLETPSNTAQIPPSTLSSSLLSPRTATPEIDHYVHTVCPNKEGVSICYSGQKLNCTLELPRTRIPPPFINHQLQLYSPTKNIPGRELPPFVFDAGCLPCNSETLHIRDSGLSSPSWPTSVSYVPHFIEPSSLQSPIDDIPILCLPPILSQELERKAGQEL